MKRAGLLNKKGYEFVEASIVLPVMILTVLSLIMTALFFLRYGIEVSDGEKKVSEKAMESTLLFGVKKEKAEYGKDIMGQVSMGMEEKSTLRAYAIDHARAVRIGGLTE